MEFLSQTYVALRGPQGTPQSPADTIGRLSDRLSPATLLADRRAAVLTLKGLARDHKQDVGDRALQGLAETLANDAEIDADIGKAVIETLQILCDTEDPNGQSKELGFKNSDYLLANEKTTHTLFALLAGQNFYTRFASLQFLGLLLHNRRQLVQGYFLKTQSGAGSLISALEDKREIIRNEAMTMLQALASQNPDIQKVLAFEGAFEKLFNIVKQEGGVDGGLVSHGALTCIDCLLRFNTSNQTYFRETTLPPLLCSLLMFPPNIQPQQPAPQEFALQFWDEQKQANANLVIGIMGMLIGPKGNTAQDGPAFTRCLVEIALSSNAPTPLKTQALRLIPPNLTFPISELTLTPYMPVPETNGEEWDRLEPATALDVLMELALHGEYNGLESDKRYKDVLELRAVAVSVFENFVRKEEIRYAIVQAIVPQEGAHGISPLLHSLIMSPNATLNLELANVTSTHISTLLFAHLLRSSTRSKAVARSIMPPSGSATSPNSNQFFVPADGGQAPPPPDPEDEDPPQSLLQILNENLTLGLLARERADSSDRESREWDRLVVGYLCLLAQWLWDDPPSVREFLDAGGMSTLVEPVNQSGEPDSLVPSLCAFLLGICYEFNRDAGEISRSTIHPILNRLGVETLVGLMTRLREDERFRAVGPDNMVLPYAIASHGQPALKPESVDEGEMWFDWAFVDFWKSNYYTIQKGLSVGPNQLSSSAGQNAESTMLISSLREVITNQAEEIEHLRKKVKELSAGGDEMAALKAEVASLKTTLSETEIKKKEVEKEQEDLLVLLDEVSSKRKKDKARLKSLGQDVSEDEEEEDDDDDE